MKVSLMRIFMVLLFALGACSGEEQEPPQATTPKVVQPIKPQTADIKKTKPALVEDKKPQPEEKAPLEKPALSQDKPAVSQEKPAVPQEKPAVAQDKPVSALPAKAEEKKPALAEPATTQAKKTEKDEPGFYVVKKGDSLSSVAAQKHVFKDPLKWPILLRLNRDNLAEWAAAEDVPGRELPQGTKLKVITAREAGRGLKKETGPFYVVNVLSTTSEAEIVPPAVTLVKQGYPVYIVRANVKGKDYMRLRVGFFKTRSEADEAGKKIKEQLHFQDSWSTKADKEEYEDVAGFLAP